MPCKPNYETCSCFLQTRLAEESLETLSYFTPTEEETVGNIVSKYLKNTPVVNVPNQFVVGKYNLDSDFADIHYCGKFGSESSHTFFSGYIQNSNVIQFGLEFETPKLCAINDNSLVFHR